VFDQGNLDATDTIKLQLTFGSLARPQACGCTRGLTADLISEGLHFAFEFRA
jgi:hypothetical protein